MVSSYFAPIVETLTETLTESAFDPEHPYYDPKWQDRERPRWFNVHVEFRHKLSNPSPVTLHELRKHSQSGGSLEHLELFVKPRLSVGKIKPTEWNLILEMAGEAGFRAAIPPSPPTPEAQEPVERSAVEATPVSISAAEVVAEVLTDIVEDMASTAAELMGEQTAESMMPDIREQVGEDLAQEVANEIAEEVAEQVEAPIAEALSEEVKEIVAEVENEIDQPVGDALNVQDTPAITVEGAHPSKVVAESEIVESEIIREELFTGKSTSHLCSSEPAGCLNKLCIFKRTDVLESPQ
jgi:hypothetical protein